MSACNKGYRPVQGGHRRPGFPLTEGLFVLMIFFAAVANVWGIYPNDHWNYSKKLNEENFESTIQEEIDAGRTMFAPAWNAVVATYAANKDVSFGDVNLSESGVGRGPPHNPGAGGWPTIRYFNKETGLNGGTYRKKTDLSMCDELGNEENMAAYVEEYGNTVLCDALSDEQKGCSEREIKYVAKMKQASEADVAAQIERLKRMEEESMKPDLLLWVKARRKILQQLQSSSSASAEL